jgi:hypothetical protein
MTPNRVLSGAERRSANELFEIIRAKLEQLGGADQELLFAYRRKVAKELSDDERSKPAVRKALKDRKLKLQEGLCAQCKEKTPYVRHRSRPLPGVEGLHTREYTTHLPSVRSQNSEGTRVSLG